VSDETLRRAMLFDFYGELLTEKQREYYDLHYNDDLSLSEIAEQTGISRQGVWDIIRRAEDVMTDMEEKTGMVRRSLERNDAVAGIRETLETLRKSADAATAAALDGVLKKLDELKG